MLSVFKRFQFAFVINNKLVKYANSFAKVLKYLLRNNLNKYLITLILSKLLFSFHFCCSRARVSLLLFYTNVKYRINQSINKIIKKPFAKLCVLCSYLLFFLHISFYILSRICSSLLRCCCWRKTMG